MIPSTGPWKSQAVVKYLFYSLWWHGQKIITSNLIVPLEFCNFETVDICGWSQDAADDFDWSIGTGETLTSDSKETRPSADHTYRTKYGKYIKGSFLQF